MPISGKFLGPTSGNSKLPPNLSSGALGSGESHSGSPSSKFIGPTCGNTNLKPERSSGVAAFKGGTDKNHT